MLSKLSTNQLAKIAAFGGVFVIGNVLLMRHLTQKRLHKSPYFIKATDVVMENRALIDFLGEPVYFGGADLGDNSRNYTKDNKAIFEVPIKGSKQEGVMYFTAVRNAGISEGESRETFQENSQISSGSVEWEIQNLEVTIKDRPNQKLVLVPSHGVAGNVTL